ncbi:hypothetical protein GGX14DRAFT_579555 [Mycena pura]|uniref:Uncharacterized protein n=1 Tax=Mycena pura TaxID=153505 RepID=A0AAD6UP87_9AGAR|nr:hypothetical protein GGX14DRAFT_579555 [Mycena pura]
MGTCQGRACDCLLEAVRDGRVVFIWMFPVAPAAAAAAARPHCIGALTAAYDVNPNHTCDPAAGTRGRHTMRRVCIKLLTDLSWCRAAPNNGSKRVKRPDIDNA